jgi:imidazolonepropionase-like amidohydrolase
LRFSLHWLPGMPYYRDKEPLRITEKKASFRRAMEAGVIIGMGGDVGVYAHGDNAREMILMQDYGMSAINVLRSATSVNANILGVKDKVGSVQVGLLADLIIVDEDPSKDIRLVKKVIMVMKGGVIFKHSSFSK